MLGFQFFSHSLNQILGNLEHALRVTLVPMIFAIISIGIGLAVFVPALVVAEYAAPGTANITGPTIIYGLAMFVAVMLMMWAAVSWHRFILLEEYPAGWTPMLRGDRVLSYLGHTLMISILIGLAMIPTILIIGVASGLGGFVAFLLGFAVIIFASVLMYRLMIILPAAAIGKPLKLSDAWEATQGAFWSILALIFIVSIFSGVLQLIAGLMGKIHPILSLVAFVPIFMLTTLLGVSVLTTLYGYYVEKRELVV